MIKTLALVREFRKDDNDTPIVLMGYYNPIYIYGVEKFLVDAKAAGVDGLIVVDLPPEEDEELCLPALRAGVNFIRLATPTTDDKRLPTVLANTSGFVYYVSITGITGAAAPDAGKVGSRRDTHQAAHDTAGLRRLRRAQRRKRGRHRAQRGRCRGRFGAGRALCERASTMARPTDADRRGRHRPRVRACLRRSRRTAESGGIGYTWLSSGRDYLSVVYL